jgi:carbon storage regulator CsrA
MLVLNRKIGQSITIANNIKIIVLRSKYGEARLGIAAPKDIQILRDELLPTNDQTEVKIEQQPQDCFTEQEAAAYINMSRSFLQHDRINGFRKNHMRGPHYVRVNRTIRYLREDLDAWLKAHRIEQTVPTELVEG